MVIIQLRQDLLHYRLSVKHRLGADPELLTILPDGCDFAVIQVDDLPVLPDKRSLLLLEIFRIYTGRSLILLFSHFYNISGWFILIQIYAKLAFLL